MPPAAAATVAIAILLLPPAVLGSLAPILLLRILPLTSDHAHATRSSRSRAGPGGAPVYLLYLHNVDLFYM